MPESVAWSAFLMGIVSACSLPLGALTIRFWRPDDRTIAVLMAFGGGALLAALTIDLVGSALRSGQFNALAAGAVLGGLLFAALNRVVNDLGGVLRKASTTIYHLRRREHQLRGLPPEELELLGDRLVYKTHGRGETFFHANVPSSRMFFIDHGGVSLIDPLTRHRDPVVLGGDDAFGGLSLLTGSRHATTAVATSDTSVWELRRADFDELCAVCGRASALTERGEPAGGTGQAAVPNQNAACLPRNSS